MKSMSTLLIAAVLSTGNLYAAGEEPVLPIREKKPDTTSFDLSKGYFSLFNLFAITPQSPDTVRFDQFLRDRKIDMLQRPR